MRGGMGDGKELKYKTKDLIEVVKKNREKHMEAYVLAVKEYREQVETRLEYLLAKFKKDDTFIPRTYEVGLTKPVSYEKDYDRAIMSFDLTTASEIDLNGLEFSQLIMDEWQWKSQFDTNTMVYAASAMEKL